MRQIGRAFTLIELMLVVAIIGLLAAIAIPKFANMVIKAKEAAILGKLGSLRSAISIYYADSEGRYPTQIDLRLSLPGKYLDEVPSISIPTVPSHSAGNQSTWSPADWPTPYAWNFYAPIMGGDGKAWVACTHTDSKGSTWSQY